MTKNKNVGEAAAISGYDFQYEILATELYNHLLNGEIEWIEFASISAGKLDDVLIGLQDRVIAYQVKEITSSKFSYSEFTKSDSESVFRGVFKGWKKLKANYPDKLIDARFITTQSVSENDSITAFAGTPKPSFDKFVKNLWKPIQDGIYSTNSIPKTWQPVVKELIAVIESTEQDLFAFIKEFSFVFEYKLNDYFYDTYTQSRRDAHIDNITKQIFRLIAKSGTTRYSKLQFLNEFGLKNNFETRFQHSFFVDEQHYQPLEETIQVLEKITLTKDKGYIALVGNAGSGKSTLLTKWLADSPHKVLKYYAYTNLDMSYDSGYRGEASFFLHDILVQIRENKLSYQDRLPESDINDLQKHLFDELRKLSYSGEKIFVIVDGLDHIDREQSVERSLLKVLPRPNSIPSNIYFVLGSRTIEQLNELDFDIREDLNVTESIVTINPLSKDNIVKFLGSYNIDLSEDLIEELYVNTKCNPS